MQTVFATISNTSRQWLCTFAVVFVCLCFSQTLTAQTANGVSEETKASALKLARHIQEQNLIAANTAAAISVGIDELTPEGQLAALRHSSIDGLTLRKDLDSTASIIAYAEKAKEHNSKQDIEIAKIYDLYRQLSDPNIEAEKSEKLLAALEAYRTHQNWFVANRAQILTAAYHARHLNLTQALTDAQAAYNLIPNDLSVESAEASYETNDLTAYLHGLLNNPELTVGAIEQVIAQGQEQGRDIDGIGYISNLIYVMEKWREYETAAALSEILINITEENELGVNGMAYLRYGQSLNNSGQYEKAQIYLRKALGTDVSPRIALVLQSQLAISFAGLGDVKGARAALAEFDAMAIAADINTGGLEKRLLQADILIARAENDARTVYRLMTDKLNFDLRATYRMSGKHTQDELAGLESSNSRQLEREKAAAEKAALQERELIAKRKNVLYLLALVACLVALAAAAGYIAYMRKKVAETMEIASVASLIGDKAKQEFLSVMSHELRTPLNGIIGIADLLSIQGETEELRNMHKIMLQSGQNLLGLLTGILDMSQMESGNLAIVTAPNDIRLLADNVYKKWLPKVDANKVIFTCGVAKNVPTDLMVDGIRFKQALDNLVSNAVKFTSKGRIHIHITLLDNTEMNLSPSLQIIVADTGIGIAKHIVPDLFRPFIQADSSTTRAHDGAGIGLTITRGLARLMGGDVAVRTTAGSGSEFTITVETCRQEDAQTDPETNLPMFIVTPTPGKKVEFTPAVPPNRLKEQYKEYTDGLRREEAEQQAEHLARRAALGLKEQSFAQSSTDILSSEHLALKRNDILDLDEDTISIDDVLESEGFADALKEDERLDNPNEHDEDILTHSDILAPKDRTSFTRRAPRASSKVIDNEDLNGLHILVVEDLMVNQEVLRSLLEPVGCMVSTATDGLAAIELMDTQRFDAVLMDIRMPGMNGIDATQHIRKTEGPHQNVAIIALTADASAETNAQCLAVGADVFLTKPVIVSELFASIRFARKMKSQQVERQLTA